MSNDHGVIHHGHQSPAQPGTLRVEVNLHQGMVHVMRGAVVVRSMRVKGGRPDHPTHTGDFHVLNRDEHHHSTEYGHCIRQTNHGSVSRAVTHGAKSCHHGETYVGTPMPFFVRFNGPEGFHEGSLATASHGCLHLTAVDAEWVYRHVPDKTPVHVESGLPAQAPPHGHPAHATKAQ